MLPSPKDLVHHIRRRGGRSTRTIAADLQVGPEELEAFSVRLRDLQAEGEILRIPAQGWSVPEKSGFRVGSFRRTRLGDAYVRLLRPESLGDIHVRADALRDAFDGDLVLVQIDSRAKGPPGRRGGRSETHGGRPRLREGKVVEVVRRMDRVVRGRFWALAPAAAGARRPSGAEEGEAASLLPLPGMVRPLGVKASVEVYVAPEDSLGARDGEKVLLRLLEAPPFGVNPRGRVIARLQDEGSLESDFLAIAAEFGFPVDHPPDALAAAEALPQGTDGSLSPEILDGREDLRDIAVFTIDPEDAKDFDDAVSIDRLEDGGFRLGVHIADVSRYVPSGSALDRSAAQRGTSIYLPGRVVPMLPERLSNDLCSLRSGEDRPAKTVLLVIRPDGEVSSARIFRSLIRSRRRFTYGEVLAILDGIDERGGGPPQGRAPYPRDRRSAPGGSGALAARAWARNPTEVDRRVELLFAGEADPPLHRPHSIFGEEAASLSSAPDGRRRRAADRFLSRGGTILGSSRTGAGAAPGEGAGQVLSADAPGYLEPLAAMADLRDILWRRRHGRGALDLDIPRLHLQVDGAGIVLGLGKDERDPSHHLIEEFMLAANEAVARFCGQEGIPLVTRIHPPPNEDRIGDFFFFLEQSNLAGRITAGQVQPPGGPGKRQGGHGGADSGDLQRIVEATAGDVLAPVIHLALLRSLAHAEYAAEAGLHFALATATYCHFTSPIRRYPDLLVHQALDAHWDGRLRSASLRLAWREILPSLAEESSRTERRAEEAEREMTKLRLIRYLANRVGEEMDALVVSIHPFGFFVRAEETGIEGLVHVATLSDDFYVFDTDALCLRGQGGRRRFRLGDRVRVALAELDPDFREINFRYLGRIGDRG